MPRTLYDIVQKRREKAMLSSVITPVIRNPVYVVISLIFVVVNEIVTYNLFSRASYSSPLPGLVISTIISSVFLSGNGNVLKQISIGSSCGLFDFVDGVRSYFLRILGFNLLIVLIVLFLGPLGVITFKPLILMGGVPSSISFALLSSLCSPFFVLWYPAMVVENIGILNSINRATAKGKKLYIKLVLCIIISLLPFIIYFGYLSLTGSQIVIGYYLTIEYYLTYGTAFILSLFSVLYLFKVYLNDGLHAHNII
jgi:hypothetical protein